MDKYIILSILIALFAISCNKEANNNKTESTDKQLTAQEETDLFQKAKQIFGTLPEKMPGSENDTPEIVELGKKLYFETKLSVNGTQSCNTCHDITNGKAGVDNKPQSPGAIAGKIGTRNSPTVLNAGFHFVQFWDGRSPDLVDQAKGPILNPVEMAIKSDKDAEKAIAGIPEYKEMFEKSFPNDKVKITFDNIAKAIAAFERTLISKSKYDFYMAGNSKALDNNEKMGMKLFIESGCITCHIGPLFGGSMYQKMGLIHPYNNTIDMGRFDVTKNEADKYIFKVASLRNAGLTFPYFHDGAVQDLGAAIDTMAWSNLGKKLTTDEKNLIKAFILSLNDSKLNNK